MFEVRANINIAIKLPFGTLCTSVRQRLIFRFPGDQLIKANVPEGFSIVEGQTYDTVRFSFVPGPLDDTHGVIQTLFQKDL